MILLYEFQILKRNAYQRWSLISLRTMKFHVCIYVLSQGASFHNALRDIFLERVWKFKCIITDTRFICIFSRVCEYPFIGRRAVDRSSIYVFSALIFPYSISFRRNKDWFSVWFIFSNQLLWRMWKIKKKIVTWHENQIYTSFFVSTFFLRSI